MKPTMSAVVQDGVVTVSLLLIRSFVCFWRAFQDLATYGRKLSASCGSTC